MEKPKHIETWFGGFSLSQDQYANWPFAANVTKKQKCGGMGNLSYTGMGN